MELPLVNGAFFTTRLGQPRTLRTQDTRVVAMSTLFRTRTLIPTRQTLVLACRDSELGMLAEQ